MKKPGVFFTAGAGEREEAADACTAKAFRGTGW
jgi:hypothetical protein